MDPENIKYRRGLIGKVIDAFFDHEGDFPDELQRDVTLWLLDENNADIKEEAIRRKFDEVMCNDSIGFSGSDSYADVVLI